MFGELYDRAFAWDPATELSYLDKVLSLSPGSGRSRVLDVGAGSGRFLLSLLDRYDQYVAVEPDDEMRSVLQRRIEQLKPDQAERVVVISSKLEDSILFGKFDLCVLLTDVLSYIYPHSITSFLNVLSDATADSGLIVLDVAIWAGYENEARNEDWTMQLEGGQVTARCQAKLLRRDDGTLFREELLEFREHSGNRYLQAHRQRLLYAFTAESIEQFSQSLGMTYLGAVGNGKLDCENLPLPGRAFLAFSKSPANAPLGDM